MTAHANSSPSRNSGAAAGRIFGIPLGDLGLFTSLLMAFPWVSCVLPATFLAILGLLIYNGMGHHV